MRAHHDLTRTSRQRNIKVLGCHGLWLEHDGHIGLQPFEQQGTADGSSCNRPTHVALPLARYKGCCVQGACATSGGLQRSLTAAQDFGTVNMGPRLPGERLQ